MEAADCATALGALTEGAAQLGVDLTPEQQETFVRYCAILAAANTRVNLTAIRTPAGIMRTLFLDSLTIAPALPPQFRQPGSKVVDVGAGAGIPGLPLKILYPAWSLTLIESTGKKARFLESVIRELGLTRVEVLAARAEEVGRLPAWRDAANLCLARAVASLPSLLELCAPLVRVGGLLVFPKSGAIEQEVTMARPAMAALRLEFTEIVPVSVELGLGQGRATVVYRKVGPTPPGYPRRVGLATSRPIKDHEAAE